MEQRFCPAKVRVERRAKGETMIIGHAAVFYDGDDEGTEFTLWAYADERCVERVMPGAFARALREQDDVRALYNHDPNVILGRTTSGTCRLREDEEGLAYEIDAPNTQAARDLLESIGRGDVSGSSFTFLPDACTYREQRDPDGGILVIRELNSVRLFDVGPVVFPAYGAAGAGLRSAPPADHASARQAYEAWKAAGRGGRLAKLATARARAVAVAEAEGR